MSLVLTTTAWLWLDRSVRLCLLHVGMYTTYTLQCTKRFYILMHQFLIHFFLYWLQGNCLHALLMFLYISTSVAVLVSMYTTQIHFTDFFLLYNAPFFIWTLFYIHIFFYHWFSFRVSLLRSLFFFLLFLNELAQTSMTRCIVM